METGIDGVRVGHWTDEAARTGCTVVLLPEGTICSGEVRGNAPGTRDFELLRPERTVPGADAVLLTGGSAFGLAAADGVMRWLEIEGRGFPAPAGKVPIVVGMVLYDLAVGDSSVRPNAMSGYRAAAAASKSFQLGRVGAGIGCTTHKWLGPDHVRPGGLGLAVTRHDHVTVAALMAVNAVGVIRPGPGQEATPVPPAPHPANPGAGANTTIGVILTNARIDKVTCLRAAAAGHDGMARAIEPAHTAMDGDALVCAATQRLDADPNVVVNLAARAVEHAIRAVAAGQEK